MVEAIKKSVWNQALLQESNQLLILYRYLIKVKQRQFFYFTQLLTNQVQALVERGQLQVEVFVHVDVELFLAFA